MKRELSTVRKGRCGQFSRKVQTTEVCTISRTFPELSSRAQATSAVREFRLLSEGICFFLAVGEQKQIPRARVVRSE